MEHDSSDRTVVVTGAARGLGLEIARAFAASGARVAMCDRDAERLGDAAARAGGAQYALDITNPGAVRETFARVERELGTVAVLVNNAGICGTESIAELPVDIWRQVLEVNLTGAFICMQAVVPGMIRAGEGRIINISSLAGRNGGIMVSVAYSASKAGLLGLTKAAAKQLARHHVNVNAVAPGALESEMVRGFGEDRKNALEASVPWGRLGSFDDIARAALFLASPAAEYITGITLDVNGGLFIAP